MTYDIALTALADPTRRRIFEGLRGAPKSVTELAAGQSVSRPAVSQHLKVLADAGLVTRRVAGSRHYYRVRPEGLAALRAYLDGFWREVLAALDAEVDRQNQSNEGTGA